MITNQDADFLFSMPKYIVENDIRLTEKEIEQPGTWNHSFVLEGISDSCSYEFKWEIWQSSKRRFKLSLHHQEEETNIGLIRVDFNSGHDNPAELSILVPSKFHPFAGKHFPINEHHVHYHVEGYKNLAWALPIEDDAFPYKELTERNIVDIIEEFSRIINLKTDLKINRGLL